MKLVKKHPLSAHRHLKLTPEAEDAQSPGLGHHYCLLWSLPTVPGGTAEDYDSPCSHCGHPAAFGKHHATVNVLDLSGLSWWDIVLHRIQRQHMPLHMTPHTTRQVVTACSSMHNHRWRSFLSEVSLWCLEVVTASSNVQTPTQATRTVKNQGNMTPLREHSKLKQWILRKWITWIAWQRIQNMVLKMLRELWENNNNNKQFSEIRKTV